VASFGLNLFYLFNHFSNGLKKVWLLGVFVGTMLFNLTNKIFSNGLKKFKLHTG